VSGWSHYIIRCFFVSFFIFFLLQYIVTACYPVTAIGKLKKKLKSNIKISLDGTPNKPSD